MLNHNFEEYVQVLDSNGDKWTHYKVPDLKLDASFDLEHNTKTLES